MLVVIAAVLLLVVTPVNAAPKRKTLEKKSIRELKEFVNERGGACVGCIEKRHLVDEAMAVRKRKTSEEQLISELASTPGMYLHPTYVTTFDIDEERKRKQNKEEKPTEEDPCIRCYVIHNNGTQSCVDMCARS